MYFVSRLHLGEQLAGLMAELKGQEPVIINLKESSLTSCIALASRLNGWIFPLLTEPIVIPGDSRTIGVINQDGTLCHNPGLSKFEREELEMNYHGVIQDASRKAFSKLNRRSADYGGISKDVLRGRTIIVCGDVVRDQLEIAAMNELIKPVKIQRLISLAGNVKSDVSSSLFLQSDDSRFMDVLANMFDDDHYFEQPESYTPEELRLLAMNISHYWV